MRITISTSATRRALSFCLALGLSAFVASACDEDGDNSENTNDDDTNVTDTNVADTAINDTAINDTAVADTNVADTTVADTLTVDTSDTAVADSLTPDTADTSVPDTAIADTTVADIAADDITVPDTTVADTSVPDTSVPDTALPDTSNLVTWDDVYPIFAVSCKPCHASNVATEGPGGHSLASTSKAVAYAASQLPADVCPGKTIGECALIRIKNGSMPAGGACQDPPGAGCPDTAEQALIQQWIDDGMLE